MDPGWVDSALYARFKRSTVVRFLLSQTRSGLRGDAPCELLERFWGRGQLSCIRFLLVSHDVGVVQEAFIVKRLSSFGRARRICQPTLAEQHTQRSICIEPCAIQYSHSYQVVTFIPGFTSLITEVSYLGNANWRRRKPCLPCFVMCPQFSLTTSQLLIKCQPTRHDALKFLV
jgi:hypothetical protein